MLLILFRFFYLFIFSLIGILVTLPWIPFDSRKQSELKGFIMGCCAYTLCLAYEELFSKRFGSSRSHEALDESLADDAREVQS